MKNTRYLLIIFILTTTNANAVYESLVDQINLEYKSIKKYRETVCAFIDNNHDTKIQKQCFSIAKKIVDLTGDKLFVAILADHYFRGIGVDKDIKKGVKFYEEVANSTSKVALEVQDILGAYYGAEDSPIKNLVKEEYWLKKAAFNGSVFSQYYYARLLKNQGKVKESVYWYKKSANRGGLLAKYKLANLFREGYAVAIDRKEAYKLLHEAASQDYAPSFRELGFFYEEDGNKQKANYWYCKFTNSDVFLNIQSGMEPEDALIKAYYDQKKKKYIIDIQKERKAIIKDLETI